MGLDRIYSKVARLLDALAPRSVSEPIIAVFYFPLPDLAPGCLSRATYLWLISFGLSASIQTHAIKSNMAAYSLIVRLIPQTGERWSSIHNSEYQIYGDHSSQTNNKRNRPLHINTNFMPLWPVTNQDLPVYSANCECQIRDMHAQRCFSVGFM